MSDSCYGHFDQMDLFSIGPIWIIFMEGRVNTCYFLDFETFLQKKGTFEEFPRPENLNLNSKEGDKVDKDGSTHCRASRIGYLL